MAIHLSPEELQSLRKLPNQLPTRGQKDFAPDGTEAQTVAMKAAMQDHWDVLSEERVVKKGALSVGCWNESKKIVEISSYQGSHWNTLGKVINGIMTLQPEEALFLVEIGALELYLDELPLSLQEVYQILISDDFPMEHYIVYAHMARLGFILCRHKKSVETSPLESGEDTPTCIQQDSKSSMQNIQEAEEVTPLVHPTDADSVASVLSKLQVIKTQRMKDSILERRSNVQIDFDAYYPGSPFKKSSPATPDFHIVVCRHSDPVPSPADLIQLTQESGTVPLKMAVVEGGGVSFYSFLDVDLPTFVS